MRKDIKIIMPPKKKEEDQGEAKRRSDWPTMLPTDEPLALPTEISFFDGATLRADDGSWEDVAEWNNDYNADPEEGEEDATMLERWVDSYSCRTLPPFDIAPKDTTTKIYTSTDSRVKESVIENEFGLENEKRWERKPLLTMAQDWEFEGHRWHTGGSFYSAISQSEGAFSDEFSPMNIRCVLKPTKESDTAIIDPSRFHEHESKKLKMKWVYNVGELKPLIYKGYIDGTYGIQVQDLSKSYAHYLSGSTPDYTYDWIEGVHYCPFDTLDTDKFKVTKEPRFDAPEVSGKFIDGRKFEVYLMPRRWAFVGYYRHSERTTGTANATLAEYYDLHALAGVPEAPYEDACIKGYLSGGTWTGTIIDSTYLVGIMYGRFPHDLATHNFSSRDTGALNEEGIRAYTTSYATIYYYNDEIASGGFVLSKDIVWEENAEDAKARFLADDGEQIEADKIYSGAGNSFHILRDATPYKVAVQTGAYLTAWKTSLDGVKNGRHFDPPYMFDIDGVYHHSTVEDDQLSWGNKRIWAVIESSAYWQEVVSPLRDAAVNSEMLGIGAKQSSRIDMIPYGIGVCPSKSGSLVGVIRRGGATWFVWRKTDENFEEEKIIHVIGEGQAHLSFQSRNEDGRLEHFGEGPYHYGVANGTPEWPFAEYDGDNWPYVFDGDITDQFTSGGSRKLVSVGREVEFTEVQSEGSNLTRSLATCSSEGNVTLDAPIYVMMSKERAMDDIPFDDPADSYPTVRLCQYGANAPLFARYARRSVAIDGWTWALTWDWNIRNGF